MGYNWKFLGQSSHKIITWYSQHMLKHHGIPTQFSKLTHNTHQFFSSLFGNSIDLRLPSYWVFKGLIVRLNCFPSRKMVHKADPQHLVG